MTFSPREIQYINKWYFVARKCVNWVEKTKTVHGWYQINIIWNGYTAVCTRMYCVFLKQAFRTQFFSKSVQILNLTQTPTKNPYNVSIWINFINDICSKNNKIRPFFLRWIDWFTVFGGHYIQIEFPYCFKQFENPKSKFILNLGQSENTISFNTNFAFK